jgi:hypothetical protein
VTAAPQREDAARDADRPPAAAWLGVALITVCAALAGLLELLLVPLYAGHVLIPAAVLFAILSNVALPRMAVAVVRSTLAAVAPFVGWLVVAVGFGVLTRPEGDVILPGGGYVEYVGYGTLLGGALAGTITVVMCTPPPRPRR